MNKKLNYFTTIKFLSKYILKRKKNFFMFYSGWLIDTILAISMPILFGILINEVIYYQNIAVFMKISGAFLIMLAFSCILYFLIYSQHHYLTSMYVFDIKRDIFKHLQKCDSQYLHDISSGDIMTTLQAYSTECMNFVTRNMIHTINHIITVLAVTTYLFTIDWQIGLLILFLVPTSVFINSKFGKKMRSYGDKQRQYYGQYISWIYEILSSLSTIRMLGAETKVKKDFIKQNRNLFNINIKAGLWQLTGENIIAFTNLATQLIIFIFLGYKAINLTINIGSFIIIMSFFGIMTEKIKILSESYLNAQTRISAIQRIYDFMSTPTEDTWKGKEELIIEKGSLVFRNIKFSYKKSNLILDDFSLDIHAGEKCAVVGKSGCGKTTLAYMMIGFYEPQNGYIEIDGQKLSECSLKSIRRNIGIIQQDVLIFDGTIRENIMLGDKMADEDEIITSCKRAGIWEFISSLLDGFDTVIGKNGIGLSGGQKQRIAIARIYLKNPKIIIFDEATSSLDKETEEHIHEAWKNVLKGRTSIVIAHRKSSVMLCDKVAIMDSGTICETGKPLEMAQNSSYFNNLFKSEIV